MTTPHCEDCQHALNARANLELKRRDYDCYGAPPQVGFILAPNGSVIRLSPDQRPVVGAQDQICGVFRAKKLEFPVRGTLLGAPRMALAGGGIAPALQPPGPPGVRGDNE